MTYYPYRKEGQEANNPNNFEPFLVGVPKEKTLTIPADKDTSNRFRFMPPWSPEGAFAKGTILHYGLGIKNQIFVCPNTLVEGSCPFCTVHAKIKGDEKYKLDTEGVKGKGGIRPANRFFSNVGNTKEPKGGVYVFPYGITIFLSVKKYQDSGEFGDLFDPMDGRDLIIDRQVRGKVTDTVMPTGTPSPILNPDWLDQMFDLDKIIPPVNLEAVQAAFRSHPWKVYSPGVSVQVPATAPTQPAPVVADHAPAAPTPAGESTMDKLRALEAAKAQQAGTTATPTPVAAVVATPIEDTGKIDDLRARIAAKLGKK